MHHTRTFTRSALLRITLAVAITGASALPTTAQQAPVGDIAVQQPWARAAIQGGVGGAFMKLENRGDRADRLVSAESPAARTVELHTTVRDGEVMRMRPVQAIEVPSHGAVQLQPGGLHIMLVGLNRPLNPGERVPLTLNFERAGRVTVELVVQAAGASGMQGHGGAGGQPAPHR